MPLPRDFEKVLIVAGVAQSKPLDRGKTNRMANNNHPIQRVAVIGAGAAGLAMLKALREEGLEPVAFEQSQEVGGVWKYDESMPGGGGPAYRSLTTNTSARMLAFSDFPLPRDLPDFPARSDVLQYLNDYADYFDLRTCIQFNTLVEKLEPTDDHRWALQLQSGSSLPKIFDAVVVASGFYREPRWPALPGLDTFTGRVIHSSMYQGPEDFAGQRVVVIGAGSSGSDIAAEISESAAHVELAAKSGVWFAPHYLRGRPSDYGLTRLSQLVPLRLKTRFVHQSLLKIYQEHGLVVETLVLPPFDLARSRVTPGTRILAQLRSGAVQLKPGVDRLEPDGVIYVDGTRSPADGLVLATGYTVRFPFLPEAYNRVAELYRHVFPADGSSLAFIGMNGVTGAAYPVSEMQARWVARVFSGAVALPPPGTRRRAIQAHVTMHQQRGTPPTRVDRVAYLEELAGLIGVRPKWWRHLNLLLVLLMGPLVAAQYRLDGPGKTDRAEDILNGRWSR